MLLDKRRAIVTGAANGIGLATARRFAVEGARVAMLDIEAGRLKDVAKDIPGAIPIACDVADHVSVRDAVGEAEASLGTIDIVIANAAIEPAADNRADELDIAVWKTVIDVNLSGIFHAAKYGLQALLRSPSPERSLVCTVSPTGIRGSAPRQSAYSASKAGVLGLMRVMANDYAKLGIRINGVMPGFTETRTNAAILADPAESAKWMATIPMRRFGKPSDVAATMAWVASAEIPYTTGADFCVDGGMTAI